MKKSLLIAGLLISGVSAFAQGTVVVGNTGTTLVKDVDGSALNKANGLVDVIFNGTIISAGGEAGVAFKANGGFSVGTLAIPGVASGPVTITLQFWDKTTGATYASATHKVSVDVVTPGLGGGTTPPGTILQGATPFKGAQLQVVTIVPEPSTYALAALGLGGLFFVSRRK
jgi:PEP-CTERM motif